MWRIFLLFRKAWQYFRYYGFRSTMAKVYCFLMGGRARLFRRPKNWIVSPEALQEQRKTQFCSAPLISIVVPLYNTPENFLKEMLSSVCAQSYENWQLCLADGSNDSSVTENTVKLYCNQYPQKIKYQRLEKNRGISANTNECIKMADGDFIALLDHDDVLAPDALYEVVKAINEKSADFIYTDETTFENTLDRIVNVHFKPDYAMDNLRANNYICHFTVFKKSLLETAGMFRSEYDGSQDHDMILRLTDAAENIVHIPKVLYYWRSHKNSVAADINSKTYAIEAGKNAVLDHIHSHGMNAKVESSKAFPTVYRIRYELTEEPLVSILIPNRNCAEEISICIKSIVQKTTYPNYEIIVIDNASDDPKTEECYQQYGSLSNFRVVRWENPFNYSSINNYGARFCSGKYLLLLNNDTKVISSDWIQEMLMYVQRPDVAAAGAKLYYANGKIQHAGVVLGLGKDRAAGHMFDGMPGVDVGYMGRLYYAQDVSAVTGACLMVKKSLYDELGGLDEEFSVALNDIDFCMRLRKAGYLIVFTPYAELYHYGSRSRGREDSPEKQARFQKEVNLFRNRWAREINAGDPYYNPNLSLDKSNFSMKRF